MRETLYTGARVFTGHAAAPWGTFLLVQDGRIRAVGRESDAGAPRPPDAEVIDLGGRVVVPGFIDAHNHYLATAEALTSVDVRYPGVGSIADLTGAIAKRAEETPSGRWIRGFGMDYAKYPGPPRPAGTWTGPPATTR